MQHEPAAYLVDMRVAVDDVISLTEKLDETAYLADRTTRLAVERQLITLGEALSQLAKEAPEVASRIPDWRRIISFRNILVHGYRLLDDRQVLSVAKDELPSLRTKLNVLIAELEAG